MLRTGIHADPQPKTALPLHLAQLLACLTGPEFQGEIPHGESLTLYTSAKAL